MAGPLPADLWAPDDLKAAARDSLNAAYAANRLLKAAALDADPAELTLRYRDLLSHAQKASEAGAAVIAEFVSARRRIGGCVPECNGVTDASFVGLSTACACDVRDAYGEHFDNGCEWGSRIHVSAVSVTEHVRSAIVNRLRAKSNLDTAKLRDEINLELRKASRARFGQAGTGREAIQGEQTSQGKQPSLDARALGVFIEHPNWTKKRIAGHLGCNEKSLAPSRCPKLAAAIAAHKAPSLPRGTKDADGNIEAWQ